MKFSIEDWVIAEDREYLLRPYEGPDMKSSIYNEIEVEDLFDLCIFGSVWDFSGM